MERKLTFRQTLDEILEGEIPQAEYSKSLTYKPSSCELSKMSLCTSWYTVLPYFSRCCPVRLRVFSLFFEFVFYMLFV